MMTKNRKRILCLLAAFMLFFTNSSIMSVFAEEDTNLSGETDSVGDLIPLSEMDSTAEANSISTNKLPDEQDMNLTHDAVAEEVRTGAGERTIYFDATQSKVNYSGNDNPNHPAGKVIKNPNSIPSTSDDSKVYYYAWNSTDSSVPVKHGEMGKVPPKTIGANTWADVWSVNLSTDYDSIVFANYEVTDLTNTTTYEVGGTCTRKLMIPTHWTSPCFYADNGDQCVYEQQWMDGNLISDSAEQRRDGYWNEVHKITTRGNDITTYVASGTETRDRRKLYINTTFFDYYSDKEINGIDRGTIGKPTSDPPVFDYTNRTYMPNKLFNTALSDYYRHHHITNPLYFGHFQWRFNTQNTYYKSIGKDLNLYGYGGDWSAERNQFYHNNNSEYRKDCTTCDENESNNNHGGKNPAHDTSVATQGLVDSSLSSSGELQMSGAKAPFFDKDFLEGANSYNTALGKVYPSVYFPFTKVNDYWTFNSKETTLRMTQSTEDDHYFLQEKSSSPVMGYTNGHPTTKPNFFPFDDADSSGKVNELNYGFGMKMDINFRLTQDGTIKDMSGNSQDITFNFSGDDDIWIFIDGQLALDIGGGHGVVSGILNFKDKEAIVGIKDPTDESKQSYVKTSTGEVTNVKKSFTLKGSNQELHTLTMYYMERGIWESNMYVSFNFPDNNVFSAEKEVDTSGIDSLFTNNANFQSNVENLVFDLDIRNLATHYAARTVEQMDDQASAAGFVMRQESIADYGSVASRKAEPAKDAKYSLFKRDSNGSENLVGTSNGNKVTADGIISLKDKQLAKFTNKFRRGSYIVVTEKTSSMMKDLSGLSGNAAEQLLTDVFDTRYTIYSKDAEVSQANLHADTFWVKKSSLNSLKDRPGVKANDGRTENLEPVTTDMNGTTISHTPITEKPANAILFRNYINPDSETVDMDLRVKYTNRFKTGAIAITKAQAAGSAALGANTSYRFTVTFDNVAGLKLEDTLDSSYQVTSDNKIQQTFTLKSGETKTFTGIPAGTKYTINEAAPTDDSSLKSVTDSLASGTVPTGVGKDTATISAANIVSGTVTADESTTNVQTFTFYNNKEEIIKTGAIAIAKAQATGSANLNADTEYRFTVTFDNVTDPNWKNTLDSSYQVTANNTIQKTFALKLGETEKIVGIPAGTEYTISEAAPTDGSTLQSVTDSLAEGTAPAGVAKDAVTISNDKVVSGKITADDTTTAVQTFTFYNMKEKTPDPEPTPEPTPKPKTTSIKITKVDSGDSDKTLSGAVFRLVKLTADGSVDKGFAAQELTTPKSGIITFSNLSDGTYRLTETKAPSGYAQLKDPATIVIKDGKYTLENNGERSITNNTISFIIKNSKQTNPPKETPKNNSTPTAKIFSLPKTGGIGTILYTLIGVVCMGGAIVFFYNRKKRKA